MFEAVLVCMFGSHSNWKAVLYQRHHLAFQVGWASTLCLAQWLREDKNHALLWSLHSCENTVGGFKVRFFVGLACPASCLHNLTHLIYNVIL